MRPRPHYSPADMPRPIIPLDDLSSADLADALTLLRAIRAGYAPNTYAIGSPSTVPAVNLARAGLIQFRRSSWCGLTLLEIVQ